jgi:hypothetical protein
LPGWIPSNYLPAKNKLQEQPVMAKLRSLPALCTGMKRSWSAFSELETARLCFIRKLALPSSSPVLQIQETLENLSASNRPVAWTQCRARKITGTVIPSGILRNFQYCCVFY